MLQFSLSIVFLLYVNTIYNYLTADNRTKELVLCAHSSYIYSSSEILQINWMQYSGIRLCIRIPHGE